MSSNFVTIQSVSNGYETIVKQDLKFKTGKFMWKVVFNIPLNPSTVNSANLSVLSQSGEPLKTHINYDINNNTIEISPSEPYAQGATYVLHITKNVESRGGQKLKAPIDLTFTI